MYDMKMKTKIVNVSSPSHELITDIQKSANSFEATAKFDEMAEAVNEISEA